MIAAPAGVRVLIATQPIDFRKGADGLAAIAQQVLGQDPFSGSHRVPGAARRSGQASGVGRDRSGADLETAGERSVQVAGGQRRGDSAVGGPTCPVAGGAGLVAHHGAPSDPAAAHAIDVGVAPPSTDMAANFKNRCM
jgi:hypothetical protein